MIIHKATASEPAGGDPLSFVMSDETVDRYGDVIEAKGWQVDHFKRNPIALFGHDSKFPVGTWKDVRVEGKRLLGRLELMPAVSDRLREIHEAVKAGVLRAVSVGFHPVEAEAIEGSKKGGTRFIKSELVECSLVSVPANPNALAIAKSLHLSPEARALIFGEPADEVSVNVNPSPLFRAAVEERVRSGLRGSSGESAEKPRSERHTKMTISPKIEAAQTRLLELRDQKEAIEERTDGIDMDDADIDALEKLNDQLARQERVLRALRQTEVESVATVVRPQRQAPDTMAVSGRTFAAPAKKVKPGDLVVRANVVKLLSRLNGVQPADIIRERYDDHPDTRTMFEVVTRAASAPATTTTTGWAAELVQTSVADFMDTLAPAAIYPRLAALGRKYTFGRNGTISIPTWASTPTIAGSFVLQGGAIPVRQGAISAITLTPKKMAVISTFTREIAEHSTPQIEALIREKMNMDTATALDTVLLDATAASTTRPAGLRNGVTETTASATADDFAALVTDLKAHLTALSTGSAGQLRRPVILMNPTNALSVGLVQNAGGDFPFGNVGLDGGSIQGIPVIVSPTVTANMIITVDAADFASVTGDDPRFDISTDATLHMEDTTPLAIGTAGSPNTVAAPVRSLFQTDTIGIRMLLDVNWAMVRTGVVAWTSAVTW